MRKLVKAGLLAAILVIGFILSACAQERVPTEYGIHGMISRIEHGDNVAYIFGSMHAGRADWFPLNTVVEDAMRQADVFVFEYDLSMDHGSAEVMALMLEHSILSDGATLEDILPRDVHENFVENAATFNGIDYEAVKTMQPMAIAMIAEAEIFAEIGILTEHSVDHYILRFAQANSKPIVGLNTFADEISTVSAMPLDVQIALMEQFTDKPTALELGSARALAEAYHANDIEKIRAMFSADFADEDDIVAMFMQDRMFRRRGDIFAAEIERLLRETEEPTTFFVTVGLGHIIGGDAGQVLYILRDRGFDVVGLWE